MASPRDRSGDRLNRKLLKLLHLLADFDGEISAEAAALLDQLRHRPDCVPQLYADVFGLPVATACSSLVQRVETFTSAQNAVASYAFTIFRSYEQMLGVQSSAKPEQQVAYDSQLEQVRLQVAKTKLVLAEALAKSPE